MIDLRIREHLFYAHLDGMTIEAGCDAHESYPEMVELKVTLRCTNYNDARRLKEHIENEIELFQAERMHERRYFRKKH